MTLVLNASNLSTVRTHAIKDVSSMQLLAALITEPLLVLTCLKKKAFISLRFLYSAGHSTLFAEISITTYSANSPALCEDANVRIS